MKFWDVFFKPNYFITIFLSGFIGIFIYGLQAGEEFVDQNKFYYIATGLPVWLLIRFTYWKLKKGDESSLKETPIEKELEKPTSQFTFDMIQEEIVPINSVELTLRDFYSLDSKVVNEVTQRVLYEIKNEQASRDLWARRILNRKSLSIFTEVNRIEAFKVFIASAKSYEDYYQIFEAFKWSKEIIIQAELKVLHSILWTNQNKLVSPKVEKVKTINPTVHESEIKIERSTPKQTTLHKVESKMINPVIELTPVTKLQRDIQWICNQRGITAIYHFTAIKNLKGIMTKGVIANTELIKQKAIYLLTDTDRNDRIYDGTCWSISHPNIYYFRRVQERFPYENWCLLEIPAKALWSKNCVFNQTNAANRNQASKTIEERSTPEALDTLFDQFVLGQGDSVRTRKASEFARYPTDVQAEVIILDGIEPNLIRKIHVLNSEDKRLMCNEINTGNIIVEETPTLFNHR